MHNVSERAEKPGKISAYERNKRRCWHELAIASHLLAKRQTMRADAFMESVAREIVVQLTIADRAMKAVTKSRERRRKKLSTAVFKEDSDEIAEIEKIFNGLWGSKVSLSPR